MTQDVGDNDLKLYSQLINMGFDDNMSLMASQNCKNVNKAIEWIENNKNINNNDCNNSNENEIKCIDINCNGNKISNCVSIKRIVSLLEFYNNNHLNYSLLNKYLHESYKFSLILSDYHHILFKHLNYDNKSNILINKQFSEIHFEIKNKNLLCNILKCSIYIRNNRQREIKTIKCNNKYLQIIIDIIDTIHCYFIHSVDAGLKIINNTFNENNNNKNKNISYDSQMKQLYDYIIEKRKLLQTIRGKKRIFNNKFITNNSGFNILFILFFYILYFNK